MKKLFLVLFLFGEANWAITQQNEKDSLLVMLSESKEDTLRVNLLYELGKYYDEKSMPDSAIFWSTRALTLAQKKGYKKAENDHKLSLSDNYWQIGDYTTAIKLSYSVFEYGEFVNDTNIMVLAIFKLTNAYRDQGDYREALKYLLKVFALIKHYAIGYAVIGSNYYGLQKYDSANFFLTKARSFGVQDDNYGWILLMTARVLEKLDSDNAAFHYYRQSVSRLAEEKNLKDLAGAYNSLASMYVKTLQPDSTIYFANQALILDEQNRFNKEKAETYLILSKVYEKMNTGKAFGYYKLAITTRDSLFSQEKQRQVSSFKFNQELNQAEFQNKLEQSQLKYRNRLNIYFLLGGLVILLTVAAGLWRRNIYRKKAIALLEKQKREIQSTLTQLKSTQAQLIQSEKMASLGELTAGIAHEIQNPLNFVNNFSEVNKELLGEMKDEIKKKNIDGVSAIADEVIGNEDKISHHGKRADAIVKGMLLHSRSSTGQKELIDVNTLADEYLRLSFHGFRAKDKSFNSEIKTDFDNAIGKINIIPQEIGRVLLNLYNNAFYTMNEKMRTADEIYQPSISVKTKKINGAILLTVTDNGNGIPQKVVEKIFQPFFTTKPTGQGTGLGLSLSYDIIKSHGGKIKVQTKEGDGSEFIIELPII
jgi:two-component system NtrC family sensor kinase